MQDFSLRRDFKYIQWLPTLQVVVIRAAGSAVVLTILFVLLIIVAPPSPGNTDAPAMVLTVLGLNFGLNALIAPWLGLICWALAVLVQPLVGGLRKTADKDQGAGHVDPILLAPLAFMLALPAMVYFGLLIGLMTGDLIVVLVKKLKPEWVPVKRYSLFNFVPIVFVVDPGQSTQWEEHPDMP